MKRDLTEIAQSLDNAAFTASAIEQISSSEPLTLNEAYETQKLSIDRRLARKEIITGYKLGFTSKAKMEQMGVHEIIWGRLTNAMSIKNEGVLNRNQFIHPRVEPEIAFLIKKDITKHLKKNELDNYISSVAGALEVIDSRYKNFKFSLEDVIADNCSSSAYIIGDWHDFETPSQNLSIELEINNKIIQSGNSNDILGNPIDALIEITRILEEREITIKEGMVILAGAATSAVHIHEGDVINGIFESLGNVRLKVK